MTQSRSSLANRAVERAFQRAGWLAELAAALDQANRLTVELCDYCAGGHDAGVLRGRILELRDEVDSMQKGRPDFNESQPYRM